MPRLVRLHDAAEEEVMINPLYVRELRRDIPGLVLLKFDDRHFLKVEGQLEVLAAEIESAIKDE